jgi:hypothetical protein
LDGDCKHELRQHTRGDERSRRDDNKAQCEDAGCSHSSDEDVRSQKPQQRYSRKTEGAKGKAQKCEESRNRRVSEDKDVRNEEGICRIVDRNVTVERRDEEDKRLITHGVEKCKEVRKRSHSGSLTHNRKKRSPSSDSESSSSSCTESSDERSKARPKKHHKKSKKLKLTKKSRRGLRKDSNTESLSSGTASRHHKRKKRQQKDESSEGDSSSEHEMKKMRRKKKVAVKRRRKCSSSEDSETDDTSSESEDQKPLRKHHK